MFCHCSTHGPADLQYDCSYCQKAFARADVRKRHERSCSKNPSIIHVLYHCHTCQQTFTQKSAWDRHMRVGCNWVQEVLANIPQAESESEYRKSYYKTRSVTVCVCPATPPLFTDRRAPNLARRLEMVTEKTRRGLFPW